jgi:hypothetical protein
MPTPADVRRAFDLFDKVCARHSPRSMPPGGPHYYVVRANTWPQHASICTPPSWQSSR